MTAVAVLLASFNVENMFRRPKALNPATYKENRPILEAYARLQGLLEKPAYSAADKRAIVELLETLGLRRSDSSEWLELRRSRGQLVSRKRDGTVSVTADGRGDVGLMTRDAWPVDRMHSHVDDVDDDGERIFSRDCPEYVVAGPGCEQLLVLVNHFKSKGYGKPAVSSARRSVQAQRVADIYRARRAEGAELVAVVGDLNDTPDSDPLEPLVQGTDLRDVSEHADYDGGGRTGTYGTGRDKIDYLLLSPALFARVRAAGVNRSGVWRGPRVKNPWPMLDTIDAPEQAASDHAAIWADVDA